MIECISRIEGLEAASDPTENAALKKNVEKIPAMCSQPEPPVKDIQKTASLSKVGFIVHHRRVCTWDKTKVSIVFRVKNTAFASMRIITYGLRAYLLENNLSAI